MFPLEMYLVEGLPSVKKIDVRQKSWRSVKKGDERHQMVTQGDNRGDDRYQKVTLKSEGKETRRTFDLVSDENPSTSFCRLSTQLDRPES